MNTTQQCGCHELFLNPRFGHLRILCAYIDRAVWKSPINIAYSRSIRILEDWHWKLGVILGEGINMKESKATNQTFNWPILSNPLHKICKLWRIAKWVHFLIPKVKAYYTPGDLNTSVSKLLAISMFRFQHCSIYKRLAHEAISLNTPSILHTPACFVHINKASSTYACIQLMRVFNGLFMDKRCLFKSVEASTCMEHWKNLWIWQDWCLLVAFVRKG